MCFLRIYSTRVLNFPFFSLTKENFPVSHKIQQQRTQKQKGPWPARLTVCRAPKIKGHVENMQHVFPISRLYFIYQWFILQLNVNMRKNTNEEYYHFINIFFLYRCWHTKKNCSFLYCWISRVTQIHTQLYNTIKVKLKEFEYLIISFKDGQS